MMKRIPLGKSGILVPSVAVGCRRICDVEEKQAEALLDTALELGCNFFDHADIYGQGACESRFAQAIHMSPSVREKIILQSKCGIGPGRMYDSSKEHILSSVDGILGRLQTEYLDVLLLHRPDALVEPEEVAEAFDILYRSGKVRFFGVSNHRSSQIRLLQKYVEQPLVADQLQFSIVNSSMVQIGMEANMGTDGAVDRDGGVLDFCRENEITIQTWSPFQYGYRSGVFLGNPKFREFDDAIGELAQKYGTTDTAVAAAWILRHPAKMQLVAGTTKPSRLKEICQAADLTLTREEWYRLYQAAGHRLP